jgi:hypothetical protein
MKDKMKSPNEAVTEAESRMGPFLFDASDSNKEMIGPVMIGNDTFIG